MDQKSLLLFLLIGVSAIGVTAFETTQQHNKIVSCYYSSWAFYRQGHGKFDVEDIDTSLCTHGFYGFADVNHITWRMYAYDPWFDLCPLESMPGYTCQEGDCNYCGYRRFVALKEQNPNFHPMLSIGGRDAGSGKYWTMAADPVKRRLFVDSVVETIIMFRFDGVDIAWDYPRTLGDGDTVNKENFNRLVDDLATRLRPLGKLLTAALGCDYDKILVSYDIPHISARFDFMNIMGYDFNGAWNNYTGHNAPIFYRAEEHYETHPSYRYNLYENVELFIQQGMPVNKMVLGTPTYGRGFTLVDNSMNGLFCPADEGFPMGPYTKQRGTFGYIEVLQLFVNTTYPMHPEAIPGQWQIVVDDCYLSPYTYNGPYWTSYDDPESVGYKVRFANHLGMAGAMIWSIETDDFGGFYSSETYPILRRINEELANGLTYDPKKIPCGSAPMCPNFIRTTPAPTTTPDKGDVQLE